MTIPYYSFNEFYHKGDKVLYNDIVWIALRKVPRSQRPRSESKHWEKVIDVKTKSLPKASDDNIW